MNNAACQSDLPSTADMVDGLMFYPLALVVSATICPGLTLCIPGLLFATVLILIPLVAIAIVVLLVAAVVAAPFVAVHGIRALARRRAAAKSRSDAPFGDLAPA